MSWTWRWLSSIEMGQWTALVCCQRNGIPLLYLQTWLQYVTKWSFSLILSSFRRLDTWLVEYWWFPMSIHQGMCWNAQLSLHGIPFCMKSSLYLSNQLRVNQVQNEFLAPQSTWLLLITLPDRLFILLSDRMELATRNCLSMSSTLILLGSGNSLIV